MKLAEKRLIFMALNDNADPQQAFGGSHWSLLVYDRNDDGFYHFDSAGQHSGNIALAEDSARQFAVAFGEKQHRPRVKPVANSPRQTNGYDCGMFVLLCAENLADLFFRSPAEFSCHSEATMAHLRARVTPDAVAQARKDFAHLIVNVWGGK